MSKSSKYKYQVLKRDGKDEGIVALNKIQSPHPDPTTGEGGNEGNGGTSNPKPPRMTLVKLAEMFVEFRGDVNSRFDKIDNRLDQLQTDVADLKVRMTNVETTLQEHGKDIKNIHSILERNNIR